MLRAGLLTLVLLGLTFSGCVSSKGAAPNDTSIPDQAEPPKFDENTGAIVGLVTDDQIQPLAGAAVGLLDQPEKTTITDKDGEFTLSNLEPGTVKLGVQVLGFEAQARNVEVVAGAASEIHIQLTPLPIDEPFQEFRPFAGYIGCSAAVIRTTLPVNCTSALGTPLLNWHELHPKGWPKTWNATVVEAVWNAQAQPDWLAFDYNDRSIGYFGVYYRYRGTNPARFVIERCGNYMKDNFGRAPVPCTDEEVQASKMHIETFYVGKYQQETHNFDSLCRDNTTIPVYGTIAGYQAGCYGVGPSVELRWHNYVSIFHGKSPDNLQTFSALPDG